MRFRHLVVTLAVALVLVAGTAWATSQVVMVEPVTPTVLTGGDVGFRVEGLRAGRPVGTVVIKVNGQWIEAELRASGRTPLSTR